LGLKGHERPKGEERREMTETTRTATRKPAAKAPAAKAPARTRTRKAPAPATAKANGEPSYRKYLSEPTLPAMARFTEWISAEFPELGPVDPRLVTIASKCYRHSVPE
jgi:hypothetical protein